MLLLLRCALTIGAIYALSPLRDPLPSRLPLPSHATLPSALPSASGDLLGRLWPALDERTRASIVASAAREAADRAAAALRSVEGLDKPQR
jgi:hypothetical protein